MALDTMHATVTAAERSRAFRERARLEADRYGPDPWIFVRELLQNSRDAGATSVCFTVHERGGVETMVCCDDGEGMTFEHARRYLFSLYASSKENAANQAGKFGVGFWSILRFDPSSITIRSQPRDRSGSAWGVRLDGALEHASQATPLDQSGTEITLHRASGDGRLEHRIYDAVWQSGRYLYRRDDPDRPLVVTVNGRECNAEFSLPAPSASFRRGSVRGVVGLGPAPRVELFSRGLRVRSAACLEDLVAPAGRHTSRMRVQFPELPGGLAPHALLESDRLEVMLSRSDARDNRALNRLVRLAQRELERLIERQLAQARPQSWWRRSWDVIYTLLRESLLLRTVVGSVVGACIAVTTAWALWGGSQQPNPASLSTPASPLVVAGGSERAATRPYKDLGARYRGPKVDVLAPGSAEPILLRYAPPHLRLQFASLTAAKLAGDGSPLHETRPSTARRYRGATCDRACVDVELPIDVDGPTRIPVPTGYRVVEGSVRLGDVTVPVFVSAEGHPVVKHDSGGVAQLRYRAVQARDPEPPIKLRTSRGLPPDLIRLARNLRKRPTDERVAILVRRVQELVVYDRSPKIAARHARAIDEDRGFIERTLDIGAGDCDVQNGLLAALLHAAGIEAKLAVGYIGVRGEVLPWLHAWVEYRSAQGRWSIADASEGAGLAQPIVARSTPPAPLAQEGIEDEGVDSEPGSPDAASTPSRPDAAVGSPPNEGEAAPESSPPDAPKSDPTPQNELATSDVADDAASFGPLAWIRAFDGQWPWLVRVFPLALVLLAVGSALSGRTRRAIKLDHAADLSRLLQGVLQQPGAFGHMSVLFNRPLVPLINGDAISLNRARELAALGRLYRTHEQPQLARRAVEHGAAVLDVRTAEGRTVADALGAVDLDRWSRLIERAHADWLSEGVNAALRVRGEDWGIRFARNVPGGMAVLDLGPLGVQVQGLRVNRLVLLDEHLPWLVRARELRSSQPNTAVFSTLDHLADRMDLPRDRRARLLASGAREALLESFGS